MQGRGEAATIMTTGFLSGWNGFTMGMATGVIVGPLVAPKPGRETREMLGERITGGLGRQSRGPIRDIAPLTS